MTVKISKPAINVREELADLKKPTGIAGEAMLRAETPQEQFNLIGAGRRNLIINGAMAISQRGTSFTSNGYTMDRFRVANGSVGNITTTQESTNSPSGVSKYSMKVTATNTASLASGSDGWIRYVIETKDIENLTLSDTTKHFTVSFYVKCSDAGQSSIGVTSGNFSSAQYVSPFTIANADTWQRVSVAIPCSSLLSNVNGDYGLRLYWDIGAGTNYQTSSTNQWVTGGTYASSGNLQISGVNGRYLQITGVQLEVGKVATPFEHRSYGEELAKCQRYYYQVGKESGDYMSNVCFSRGGYLDLVYGTVSFPTELRTTPTVGYGGNLQGQTFSGGYATKTTTGPVTSDNTGKRTGGIRVEFPSDWTAGDEVFIVDNDGTGFISFDAEL
jgi:hypothetical protein